MSADRTARRRLVFFFNDTATTEIYTLSLHDALPISSQERYRGNFVGTPPNPVSARVIHECMATVASLKANGIHVVRSEEHTSELQSPDHLVCRLLLEKTK